MPAASGKAVLDAKAEEDQSGHHHGQYERSCLSSNSQMFQHVFSKEIAGKDIFYYVNWAVIALIQAADGGAAQYSVAMLRRV